MCGHRLTEILERNERRWPPTPVEHNTLAKPMLNDSLNTFRVPPCRPEMSIRRLEPK